MSSPAYEVARYLEAQAVGVFAGASDWAISVGSEPVLPANCVTIYDQAGSGLDTDELDLINIKVQVRVRCVDYLTGYAKSEAIRDLLTLTQPLLMGSTQYIGLNLESDIWCLGRNDNGQYMHVANYLGLKQRV